ncbi:MAG TPA: peptidylprolyl isomerase [Verrucomicrobiae bacterium]
MFGTIRKHQQWLWIFIATITIISFVYFFSPDAKWGGRIRSNQGDFGSMKDKPVTREQWMPANKETMLRYFFQGNGKWPEMDENTRRSIDRDTLIRLFLIDKLKEMDIQVSDTAVARLNKERLGSYPLSQFEKEHLERQAISLEDYDRFLRHEIGIQQLMGAAAVCGKLVNPAEAEDIYKRLNQEYATELAVFAASNYISKVLATPEAIGQFYTQRQSFYRLPERLVVSYVEFPATNYFAKADELMNKQSTNVTEMLNKRYLGMGTNKLTGPDGKELNEADTKKKLREEIRENTALQEARRAASEFGGELMDKVGNSQPTIQLFENFAAAKSLPTKTTPPFDRAHGLENTNFPPDFATRAFALGVANPIGYSPIIGDNAVYVIGLKERQPSVPQPFEKVKDKVTEDFKHEKALEVARNSGTNFVTTATNSLAQKKSFAEICAAAKVPHINLPPLAQSTPPFTNLETVVNMQNLKSLVRDVPPGQMSKFDPTPEGGVVLYVDKKLPMDEAKFKKEFPEFLGRLRLERQNEAFNQWFRKQAEQAKLQLPKRDVPSSVSAGGTSGR